MVINGASAADAYEIRNLSPDSAIVWLTGSAIHRNHLRIIFPAQLAVNIKGAAIFFEPLVFDSGREST